MYRDNHLQKDKEERIYEHLYGQVDGQDEKEFREWLESDPEALALFRKTLRMQSRARWAARWSGIDEDAAFRGVMGRLGRKQMERILLSIAAVFVCALGLGLSAWFGSRMTGPDQENPVISRTVDAKIPLLVLDNGEKIGLTPRNNSLIKGKTGTDIHISEDSVLSYPVGRGDGTADSGIYNTIIIPKGGGYRLTLADGTKVWLNTSTTLRYPVMMKGPERNVYLDGEAYFEVAADAERPFYVHTEQMDLRVLGTVFNIRAYKEDSRTVTALVSGKVAQRFVQTGKEITLEPGQASRFDAADGRIEVGPTDLEEILAWKEGRIILNDVPLSGIFQELSRWYDLDVRYLEPELEDLCFYLHAERGEKIENLLKLLEDTRNIHFDRIGKTIYVRR